MLMPFHKIIASNPAAAHVWAPMDDENTMLYSVDFSPQRPFTEEDLARSKSFRGIHTENIPGTDRALQNRANDYLIDRKLQASGQSFTGMRGLGIQDCAVQESMGPIADRTLEHLGISDTAIVKIRRLLLQTLKDHAAGKPLPAPIRRAIACARRAIGRQRENRSPRRWTNTSASRRLSLPNNLLRSSPRRRGPRAPVQTFEQAALDSRLRGNERMGQFIQTSLSKPIGRHDHERRATHRRNPQARGHRIPRPAIRAIRSSRPAPRSTSAPSCAGRSASASASRTATAASSAASATACSPPRPAPASRTRSPASRRPTPRTSRCW